jgi:hypothetical protein
MSEYLDKLTKAKTAFATWAELTTAMDNGYVPTIYPKDKRSNDLRKTCAANGYKVWPK